MIKKYINKFVSLFGYTFQKKYKREKFLDNLYPILFKKNNPVVFDVGANKGQSIKRYRRLFENPTIHSFEPIKEEYELISERYKDHKNIFISNVAAGEKTEEKFFNVTKITGHSSFLNIKKNTRWINERSRSAGVSIDNYITKQEKVSLVTLDDYCEKNNVEKIDILKIDTQGYEDKVLSGCIKLLKSAKINSV